MLCSQIFRVKSNYEHAKIIPVSPCAQKLGSEKIVIADFIYCLLPSNLIFQPMFLVLTAKKSYLNLYNDHRFFS